jgi:hypothetical protein
MRVAGLLIGFLAVALFVLPSLPAQEKDKKAEKDTEKPEPEKKDTKKEEKLEHGPIIPTRIISMKPDSAHDFTVEIPQPDPAKMQNFANWQQQQMVQINNSPNPQVYAQRVAAYQQGLAQHMAQGFASLKPVEVRATDACKVRVINPPPKYDDAGNLVKPSRKDLEKMKDKSKLPGYPADFDALKTGQFVQIYLAKPPPAPKVAPKKKKDEDPPDQPMDNRPSIVMIVIVAEPMMR